MKILYKSMLTLLCCASLSACNTLNNQDVGTLAGGVAGGILGSTVGGGSGRLVAIAAGSMAGAAIGSNVGRHMDQSDRRQAAQALENNNVGQPAYWRNQRTGATYKVVPKRNVKVKGNPYCREYITTAMIAGKKQQIYGTACRRKDGSWKVVK